MEDTQEFFFLELNPRLQARRVTPHPIPPPASIPAAAGRAPGDRGDHRLQPPALQLMVAMGIDLSKVPDDAPMTPRLGRFLVDPTAPTYGSDPFSRVDGHVIAVHITAENASDGWKPTVGAIAQVNFLGAVGVGLLRCGRPAPRCTRTPTRSWPPVRPRRAKQAQKAMIALKRLRVVGEISTNVQYVCELIMMDDFANNATTRAGGAMLPLPPPPPPPTTTSTPPPPPPPPPPHLHLHLPPTTLRQARRDHRSEDGARAAAHRDGGDLRASRPTWRSTHTERLTKEFVGRNGTAARLLTSLVELKVDFI